MSKTIKLIALEPIKANGKRHEPGQELEVDEATAVRLVETAAAEPADGARAKKASDKKPDDKGDEKVEKKA